VMTPLFRAKNAAPGISDEQIGHLTEIGNGHLLTPEQLNRKIENVIGLPWTPQYDRFGTPNLLSRQGDNGYRMLYGGIDSENVTQRITHPNGIMANVIERMGLEVGCNVVAAEFSLPATERKLLGLVDPTIEPEDVNGYAIPQSVDLIKQNIAFLHERLLNEKLDASSPELERTYQLFLETWREGKKAISDETQGADYPYECRAGINYLTGEAFAEDDPAVFTDDALFTGRAWMTVIMYLLTDYAFVYE